MLTHTNHNSHHKIKSIIKTNHININNKITKLNNHIKITPKLKIHINNHLISIHKSTKQIYHILTYYKPKNKLYTHNNPKKHPTIFNHLPKLHNTH